MLRYKVEILPAVFTPMFNDGTVNYQRVADLYRHCTASGYKGIFLNGTTGECMSLNASERKKLLESWASCKKEFKNKDFRIFAHVGSANLLEAAELAEHAQASGADAIAMVPTFYFRPRNMDDLIDQCRYVAGAAPDMPFYYYNIPSMTGVNFPLSAFLERAPREIPSFAGLKNSFNDLVDYQQCLHSSKGEYDLYWGSDEVFMMLYTGGNRHYVGSTYNFMGSIYFRMLDAYHAGNFEKLTTLEAEATAIYNVLGDYNAMIAGKEIMKLIGIDCGPVRRPLTPLTSAESARLAGRLKETTLFELALKGSHQKI